MFRYDDARTMTGNLTVIEEWARITPDDPITAWYGKARNPREHSQKYPWMFYPFHFLIVLKGRVMFHDRAGVHDLRPGNMGFAGPWEPHMQEYRIKNTQTVNMIFLPSFLYANNLTNARMAMPFLRPKIRDSIQPTTRGDKESIVTRAFLMADTIDKKTALHRKLAGIDLQRLLLEVTHHLPIDSSDNQDPNVYGYSTIFSIFDFIESNLHKHLGIDEAARSVLLSRSKFISLFKEITGQSFAEYVKQVRLDKAKQRILSSDDKLAYIATELGFADKSHFSRAFKAAFGISPGQLPRGNPQYMHSKIGRPTHKQRIAATRTS